MPKFINHLTLITGDLARAKKSSDDVSILKPWLSDCIDSNSPIPIPYSDLSHFAAVAYIQGSNLVMTVYAPNAPHQKGSPAISTEWPLVTFAVASRSRGASDLWSQMIANFETKNGIKMPSTPWIAAAIHPAAVGFKDELSWLGKFEQDIAWTWMDK